VRFWKRRVRRPPAESAGRENRRQENTIAAMMPAAQSKDAPRRLVLGSDAWRLIATALRQRQPDDESRQHNPAMADVDSNFGGNDADD
jgi:hypothetical protein